MIVERHEDIEKDFRNLKRFAAPQDSLDAWQRLFCLKGIKETPGIDPFPGFGSAEVYKGRVVPLRENVGKSKGYRVVFKKISEECYKVLVFSRHGIYKSEQELMNLIKARISQL